MLNLTCSESPATCSSSLLDSGPGWSRLAVGRLLSQSREVAWLPFLSGSVPAPPQWAFPRNSLFFPGRAQEPGVEGGGRGSGQCQLQSPLT